MFEWRHLPPRGGLMRISARNQLKGKVAKITPGPVNAEVILTLDGGQQIAAVITNQSVNSLGLAVGKEAYAIVKASTVMLGVD
jgi:molybdate transport system regulatory protein